MLNNLKIGTRLGVGYGIIVVALVIVSVFTFSKLRTLADLTDQLYIHPFAVRTALGTAQTNIIKMHRSMKDVAMAKDLPAQSASSTCGDEYGRQSGEEGLRGFQGSRREVPGRQEADPDGAGYFCRVEAH